MHNARTRAQTLTHVRTYTHTHTRARARALTHTSIQSQHPQWKKSFPGPCNGPIRVQQGSRYFRKPALLRYFIELQSQRRKHAHTISDALVQGSCNWIRIFEAWTTLSTTLKIMATLGILDYVVLVFMLAISAVIGVYAAFTGDRQRTSAEYLLGNRQMNFITVGLSVMISFASAINILGIPAEIYLFGTTYWWGLIAHGAGAILVAHTILPVFYRLGITSVYTVGTSLCLSYYQNE